MSDRLPNAYPTFPNNLPQGPPAQQAQHHPPQQPQQVGSQPPPVGISNEVWQQMQYRHQQQQQSAVDLTHGGGINLYFPQRQPCLPLTYPSPYLTRHHDR